MRTLLRSHSDGALPTFVIIGAMKAATTSLHYYLSLHPEVSMSAQKELAFFVAERNWDHGLDWYRAWFSPAARARGEASPQYTQAPIFGGVPERMAAVLPEARLVYVVRDPVDRALAHYRHQVAVGKEGRPLDAAVLAADSRYLQFSRYHEQIAQYLPHFAFERILVVEQEAIRQRRRETLRRVFAFVGVEPDVWDWRFAWERHRGARKRRLTPAGERLAATWPLRQLARVPHRYRWPFEDAIYRPFSEPIPPPVPTPGLRREIAARLASDVAAFRALTGRSFDAWTL